MTNIMPKKTPRMIRAILMIFFNAYPIKNPTSAEPPKGITKLDILPAATVVKVEAEVELAAAVKTLSHMLFLPPPSLAMYLQPLVVIQQTGYPVPFTHIPNLIEFFFQDTIHSLILIGFGHHQMTSISPGCCYG